MRVLLFCATNITMDAENELLYVWGSTRGFSSAAWTGLFVYTPDLKLYKEIVAQIPQVGSEEATT